MDSASSEQDEVKSVSRLCSPDRAYDANGNTLSDAQGRSFTWDFENRLTQAVVPGTNGGTTTFKYDPFGRRIQKSGPLGTTNYLYDGTTIEDELDNIGMCLHDIQQTPMSMSLCQNSVGVREAITSRTGLAQSRRSATDRVR